MKTRTPSKASVQSSTRPAKKKAGEDPVSEISHTKPQQNLRDTLGKKSKSKVREKDQSLKAGAAIATGKQPLIKEGESLEGAIGPRKSRKVKPEVSEQSSVVENKIQGQGEDPHEVNGSKSQGSKRKRITRVEGVEAEESVISPKKAKRTQVKVEHDNYDTKTTPSPRPLKIQVENKVKGGEEEDINGEHLPTKSKRNIIVKKDEKEELDENGEPIKKVKRKRKTKEEKEAEAMPLAARTNGLRMYIGAHVSCAKGVQNSVTNCVHIGGNAFAMFLKSQRKWDNPPLQDEHRDLFISSCQSHKYDASSHILPHGSYLVNLAQEEPEKATQAYNAFLDDLHRCEALGIKLYNFHPGWTGSHPRPSAIGRIAQALNRAHLATKTVIPVLETMAGGGNVIGSTFEDLRDIIALIDDKTRIGICLDTCHVFAAGYDLRAPEAFKKTLDDFDNIIGMKYLRALHLNDSKAPFNSHRDLHQNIGLGFLGLRAFHNIMNEPRFEGLPMVLETPIDHEDSKTGKDVEDKGVWAKEIKMLEGLIGMDANGDEFGALERELAEKGREEREKLQEQFNRKVEKDRKAAEKGQTKLSFGRKKMKKKGDESEKGSESEA